MKRINYDLRSKWYDKEIEYKDVTKLLLYIQNKYLVNSIKLIPCGSGIDIKVYSRIFENVAMADINQEMLTIVSKKKIELNLKNVYVLNENLKDINFEGFDCIIILRHTIQFLKRKELIRFLNTIPKHVLIVMETFNFKNNTYPWYLSKTKNFQYLNCDITREGYLKVHKNHTKILYKYFGENVNCSSSIKFYNYGEKELESLFFSAKLKIFDKFADYDLRSGNDSNVIWFLQKD